MEVDCLDETLIDKEDLFFLGISSVAFLEQFGDGLLFIWILIQGVFSVYFF